MEHELRRVTIAAAVRGEMTKQGTHPSRLAEAANISDSTLRRRFRGEQPFNADEFAAMCHTLRVPLTEMLDRAGVK